MNNKPDVAVIISEINKAKNNRKGCQGLSSSLASDGYIRSIVNWTKVTSPDRIDSLVEHIEELQRKVEALTESAVPVRYMNRFTGACFTLEQQPNAATETDVYIPLIQMRKEAGQ